MRKQRKRNKSRKKTKGTAGQSYLRGLREVDLTKEPHMFGLPPHDKTCGIGSRLVLVQLVVRPC